MRKPAFCICENKDADQLRGKRLCFRYTDTGSIDYPVGKESFVYLHFYRELRYMYTEVIGKNVNKQRIVCDKIAEPRYSTIPLLSKSEISSI